MNARLGFPEQPSAGAGQLPVIYVKEKPVWEYRRLVRNLSDEEAPTEAELNALGADSWELAGMFTREQVVYFYFKRLIA